MILLAGGAGFIGSHIAVELLNAGKEIIIADNFANSHPNVLKAIKTITEKDFVFSNINITNISALRKLFQQYSIESVIHLANLKSIRNSLKYPLKYYSNNLNTTLALLHVMQLFNVKRIIFSSSATVYGIPQKCPITENAPVSGNLSPYGRSKYYTEQIMRDWANTNLDSSVVILRYFNPIGAHESGLIGELPKGTPDNLMPYLTQTAAGIRHKFMVFGNDYPTPDGTCIRDYIHVVDLAKGHLASLQYAMNHEGVSIFNLGSGIGYSVLEVLSAFEKNTGIKINYEFTKRRPGDIPECYASTSKANTFLNWRAEKTLDNMCRDAWRWQQQCINSKTRFFDGECL